LGNFDNGRLSGPVEGYSLVGSSSVRKLFRMSRLVGLARVVVL